MKPERLTQIFSQNPSNDLSKTISDYACVSLILKKSFDHFELAFIRRAHNPQDPWSGQIAFPGGRREKEDANDIATALRETREEVGWQLKESDFLGFLSDVQARSRSGILNFFLRPLVFYVSADQPLDQIDPKEVDQVFWISHEYLENPKHKTSVDIPSRGFDLPGIKLPTGDTLWGLTYMVTQEILQKLS